MTGWTLYFVCVGVGVTATKIFDLIEYIGGDEYGRRKRHAARR